MGQTGEIDDIVHRLGRAIVYMDIAQLIHSLESRAMANL